ncbi:MAG: hypothetical protein HY234_08825 [Acidobacteria bacterium]|nr:hypothetical protein [Acidobacteriota bacterium]MBI3663136.1 hypothetical protein [Acidobacteriota bacterium]
MRRVIPALLGLLLAFPVALAAQQQEPNLVEAARKAREAKKSAPKAKLVFTNDNIPTTPDATTTAPDTAAAPADASSKASAAASGEEKKGLDGADWRKRFSEARGKLASAEKELDILQRELNLNQQQYYSDPNKAMREQYTRGEINKGRANIDAKKQEVEQLRRALADLEDELRRAGGPPSWARP